MEVTQLIDQYPRLFHMATAGSWPSIRDNGLWTTDQIANTSGLSPAQIREIATSHRPRSIALDHPILGPVVVRDQAALRPVFASSRIVGMSVEGWVRVLNSRVFFWLHPSRLQGLLGATRYRSLEQDVIVVDTESLVRAHLPSIQLSPINSGATIQANAPLRGASTFESIEDYPFADRRRGRTLQNTIAELCVVGGVPDVASHVLSVQRWRGDVLIDETRAY